MRSDYEPVSSRTGRGLKYETGGCNKARGEGPRGIFAEHPDAARRYDRAALTYFGEFARLNFTETEG